MSQEENSLAHEICQIILKDKKKDRIWRNIRFFTWSIFIVAIFFFIFNTAHTPSTSNAQAKHFALIRMNGEIMPNSRFSASIVMPELHAAFKDKTAKGVMLLINSPGGSPTQASIIHDKIIALKQHFHKKVIVVAEDSLTSAAYLIATAADKIYVNKDTITGSIGVIMSGFGFTEAMQKMGISRRVYYVGPHKDRLDPFLPINPSDKEKIKAILIASHNNFIDDVEAGRKNKLHGSKKILFSGDFWLGNKATRLGLVDGTMNQWQAAEQAFGTTHFIDYTTKPSFLTSLVHGINEINSLNLHAEAHTHILSEQL